MGNLHVIACVLLTPSWWLPCILRVSDINDTGHETKNGNCCWIGDKCLKRLILSDFFR